MRKILFCLMLTLATSFVYASSNNDDPYERRETLRLFFKEVSKEHYSRRRILKKFINPLQRKESKKRTKLFNECLVVYHNFTIGKNLTEITFIPETEMPLNEQIFADNPLGRDIISIQYQKKHSMYVLFNKGKIRSLITVRQGDGAIPYFLDI